MAKRLIDEAGEYVGKIVAVDFTGGNIVWPPIWEDSTFENQIPVRAK